MIYHFPRLLEVMAKQCFQKLLEFECGMLLGLFVVKLPTGTWCISLAASFHLACLAPGTVLFTLFVFQLHDYATFTLAVVHTSGKPLCSWRISNTLISTTPSFNVLFHAVLVHPSDLRRKIKIIKESFAIILIRLGSRHHILSVCWTSVLCQ